MEEEECWLFQRLGLVVLLRQELDSRDQLVVVVMGYLLLVVVVRLHLVQGSELAEGS